MPDAIAPDPVSNGSVPSSDWRPFLGDDLKADPVVSAWSEKTDYKDIPSLIKGMAHAQHRMGSAVNIPGKDAKPEDVQAFKQKLIESGVLPAPPADVSVYNIQKPETLAEGTQWNDGLAKSFGDTLFKHGASPEMAKDMLALYAQALGGQMEALKISGAESLASLKAEHKEKFDEHMEAGERLAQSIFKTPEEVEFFKRTGLGTHPQFQSVMMRLGANAMQDSSFVDSLSSQSGASTGHQVYEELARIQTDKTHPMHMGYKQNDPKVMEHISALYRKTFPGTVELG